MTKIWLLRLLLFLLSGLLLGACSKTDDTDPNTVPEYQRLSEYGFFRGALAELQPADRVLAYDLISPLFTDYAWKARFVYVPAGKQVAFRAQGLLDFPVGSVLIKTFYYPEDFRNPNGPKRIIETRLLVHNPKGWEARNYRWNAAQTEATRDILGGTLAQTWIHYDGQPRTAQYLIPNRNQCRGCHELDGKTMPIGPQARNLHHNQQLEQWIWASLMAETAQLGSISPVASYTDTTESLERRARAYLDINCAHCHSPGGPAKNSGLYLQWENTNPSELGFCKRPIAAGRGSGGLSYGIVPGHPERSILVYRMQSLEADIAMPELGRSQEHTEGVQLIRDWIASLPSGECQ